MDFCAPPTKMLIRVHAAQRAFERYGVEMTEEDASDMARQCRDQRGIFVRRKGHDLKVWLVWWPSAKRIVPAYYSNKHKLIASVLPVQAALPHPSKGAVDNE